MNKVFLISAIIFYLVKNYIVSWYIWKEFVLIGFNPKSFLKGEIVPFLGGLSEGILNVVFGGTLLLITPNSKMLFSLIIIGVAYLPWIFLKMNSTIIIIEFIVLTIFITLSEMYTIRLHNIKLLDMINNNSNQ